MQSSRASYGFTLIEILVAILIFSLIASASTAVLYNVIQASEQSKASIERLQMLQRTMTTIERDLLQAVNRPPRIDGVDDNSIVFRGGLGVMNSTHDGVSFVRNGWQNPMWRLPRSNMQGVAYRLSDEQVLERLHTTFVDNDSGVEPKIRPLLTGVTDLNIEFMRAKNARNEIVWDETYTENSVPKGVAVEITTKDFGLIRREFALLDPPVIVPTSKVNGSSNNAPSEQNSPEASQGGSQ
ncbi:MAG: Type II secretion system protein J [Glaciecola sp. HTCC2999]|jgi:general secretion pathway protein J|nr:MAG: Type II secretion system protein J [Glaciecola sp. HTCC2999]